LYLNHNKKINVSMLKRTIRAVFCQLSTGFIFRYKVVDLFRSRIAGFRLDCEVISEGTAVAIAISDLKIKERDNSE